MKGGKEKALAPAKGSVDRFSQALARELTSKFTGHWYEDEPARGSGFRAVSNDHRLDSLVVRAGESANIMNVDKLLQHTRGCIMFVNPGVVASVFF